MQGLQQSLTSARVVSEAAVNFFDDIHLRSSRVMKILEENQNERFQQLTNFEKKFKVWKYYGATYTSWSLKSDSWLIFSFNLKQEEVEREEEQALEKIAEILAALTSKKTAMVSRVHCSFCSFPCCCCTYCIKYRITDFWKICIRSQRHQDICRTQACNSLRDCS